MKTSLKDLKIGDTFPTREGYVATVVEIINALNIVITYNDPHPYSFTVRLEHLNNGRIKNPFKPTTLGIGYFGVGNYVSSVNDITTPECNVWKNMMRRCYCSNAQLRRPTYIGVIVCDEWHNFQNFAHWYVNQPQYGWGYQIDKDILYPGNRVYSPATCTMVPTEINNAMQMRGRGYSWCKVKRMWYSSFREQFIGYYKNESEAQVVHIELKRQHIIDLAHEWELCITPNTFDAMLDFADNLSVEAWYSNI